MKITRIVSDPQGVSRFVDETIALSDKGKFGRMSDLQPAPGIIFREVGADYDSDWHVVPHPLYLIVLGGELDIEVGTGERRRFPPGSILHPEDASGRGHRTRAAGGLPVQSLLVNSGQA